MGTIPERGARPHRATVRVLGEGVEASVDLLEGVTAADLIRAAGTTPRANGWDLFLDGAPTELDKPVDHTHDVTLAYVPRIRGG
jgi:hypothetical protein